MKGIRLKYLAELNPKTNLQTLQSEDVVSFAPMECVKQGYMMPYEKSINDYNSSYNVFRHDDIVLAKVTPCFENGNIAIAAALKNDIGYGSSELFVIRANKCNNLYLFYLLQSNQFRQTAISTMTGAGGLKRVSPDAIKNLIVSIADVNFQQRIADYLDRKTSAIDSLIAEKQKLVELLKEKRNAVISEAVTTGLDKTVKMKDSGIDWIGKIPEDYEILPLFAVASENKIKNIGNICDNLLSLSYGNIIRKDINTNDGLLPESFETYQIVDEGYTVLRLTDLQNDKRSLRTGYVNERGIITSAYVGLIPSERIDGIYLSNLLHGYDLMKIFYALGNGVRQSMKYADLKRLAIVVPPIEKQKEISAFLVRKTAEIDSLISDINEQIEKLKEYRQSVISEVVTGKVAV